ncbi:hypothetical protein [Aneurinibacillus uraniidurans]|uniref:hypothetical protein n=1 Tax=Aneurinibacillus uraniidurans TaxID=2966586 RepID=UPI00234B8E8E|nr:hypothetical protein [Aneurinibacillus sp. B1]WCN36773.1 hypothetical protein PO771_12955 [Aneurinibacillus sp. B1]
MLSRIKARYRARMRRGAGRRDTVGEVISYCINMMIIAVFVVWAGAEYGWKPAVLAGIVLVPFGLKLEDGIFALLGEKAYVKIKPLLAYLLRVVFGVGILLYMIR